MAISTYANAVAKELYAGQTAEKAFLKDHAFLTQVKKESDFFGKLFPQPIQYGYGSGRSATFATAQANKMNGKYKQFALTRYADYALVSIKNEDAEALMNDKGGFVNLMKNELDGGFESATDSCARDIYGTGSGKIGQVSSSTTLASTNLVLVNPDDAFMFEEGMVLVASATDGTGSVRTGSVTVAAVNRTTGAITTTANLSTGIAAIAANDFLFPQGDYALKMPGIFGWIPDADPTGGDNFFGVDRSVDPERLAGLRFDASSLSIEEGLVKGVTALARRKARPDMAFMHPTDWANLELSLGSKVQYVDVSGKDSYASLGFRGIKLQTPTGVITVVSDAYARLGRIAVVTMKTWYIKSLNKYIRVLNLDGNEGLRESTADAIEYRIGGYKVLGCNLPGQNMNIKLY